MKEIIITSSILICAVLLMRFLFRGKVSRRLIYASWLLVALRLLIPVQLGHFSFSVLNQVESVTGIMDSVAKEPVSGASREEIYQDVLEDYVSNGTPVFIPEIQDKVNIALPDMSFDEIYDSLPEKGENIILPEIKEEIEVKVQQSITVPTLGQIAKVIWVLGMGAMLIWFAGVNIQFNSKLRKASETVAVANSPVPVKISPLLSSPCLFGFLRPTVYLTHNCREDGQIRRHVLTHELTHWKHKDHIWSLVRCVCLCVYWFNPLVWIAAFTSKRDCELACDEAVLKQLGESERLVYGKTLVDMVATNPTAANLLETATAMHETKKALKERVNHIVKRRKHFLICALCLILVLSIVAGCSFTGKKTDTPETTDPAGTTEPVGTTTPPGTTEPEDTTPPTTVPEGPNGWIINEGMYDYASKIRVYSAFDLTQGMQELVDEFNTYYPNITVEWHTYSNQAVGGMHINTLLANGEVDVFYSFGLNYTFPRWASKYFMDITDELAFEGVDMVANWGTDAYQYNGRYYSIPCGGLQYYVAINKNAWDEAELGEIPTEWTWDEYIEASRKMTKINEDGSVRYGGSSFSSINTIMYCGAQVSGGDLYFNADGTKSNYSDPVVLRAFERELNAELVEKIWFPVKTYRDDKIQSYQTFLTGQVASTVTTNVVRNLTDAEFEATSDFITAFAPFPTEEGDQTNYLAGVHPYTHIAVAEASKDKAASWLFVTFAATYGAKYLAVPGHHSNWRGTTAEDTIQVLFGSEENAAKYMDLESYKNTIGRTDKPFFQELVRVPLTNTYSQVMGTLFDPLLKALNGELTAEECLQQAARDADAFLNSYIYETAFNLVKEYGYEGEEGKYLAQLCYQDIDKFLYYAAQAIDPNKYSDYYIRSDYSDYKRAVYHNGTDAQRAAFKEACLNAYRDPDASFRMRYAASLLTPLSHADERPMRYEALESHKEIEFEAEVALIAVYDDSGYDPQFSPSVSLFTTTNELTSMLKHHKDNNFFDSTVTNDLATKSYDEIVAQYDEAFFEDSILLRLEVEVAIADGKLPTVEKVTTGEPCYWMDRFCVHLSYTEGGGTVTNPIPYEDYVIFIAVPKEYYQEPIGINDYEFDFNCCINGVPFQNYG